MTRVAAALALALCLVGCGLDEQVPLITDASVVADGGCILLFQVVDVIADATSGTPLVKETGEPLRWPRGYTARRAGLEVEVLDAAGIVVLTTGARYWMCPQVYVPVWVIGTVRPCPDCKLEHGVL